VSARVRAAGVAGASPIDLIALGFARSAEDVDAAEPMARRIVTRYGTMQGLGEASPAEISSFTGLEGFELQRAMALMELGRRTANSKKNLVDEANSPDDVARLLDYLLPEKREHFVAILVDSKNHVLRVATIHIGTLTASLVGPREVFREAIREGASSVVLSHNHPSGDPTPSPEDWEITRMLIGVGKVLDIPVNDHIILGTEGVFSMRVAKPGIFA
jgi:DNA repair protein RadC